MKTHSIYATVLLLMYIPIPVLAISDNQKEMANRFLSKRVTNGSTPGIQYVFADRDAVLFQFSHGFLDIKQRVPVDARTTFNGYSITKTFTAAAVVKLAREGKIDLDAPISQYVNDFPYKQSPTVRQTLQHTAGFPNPIPMAWIHRLEDHPNFDEQAFIHEVINKHDELDFDPGEKFSYSNLGYVLLGQVVSHVSGITYEQYVMNEIIQPIGMVNGEKIAFDIEVPSNHANGHIRKLNWLNFLLGWFIDRDLYLDQAVDGWVPFHHTLVNGKAYGGLVGNSIGFVKYLQTMLAKKEPFNQELLDEMWKTGTTNSGEPIHTGLAWFHGVLDGKHYFAHSGGAGGYYGEIRVYPDLDRASVVMTNNTGISNQHYLDQIDPIFLSGGEDHEN